MRLLANPGGAPVEDWTPPAPHGRVVVAIGPEGGFTAVEVESARSAGWWLVGLGPLRLRVETAGLVASALVLARAGARV
jgi:16S rRNA (uracil1498-N3)-methyltransferase